jgi:hypothetical protein
MKPFFKILLVKRIKKQLKEKKDKKKIKEPFSMHDDKTKYIIIGVLIASVVLFMLYKSRGKSGSVLSTGDMHKSLLSKLRNIPLE